MKERISKFLLALMCAAFFSPAAAGKEVRVLLLPISFKDCPLTYSETDIQSRADAAAKYFKDQLGDDFTIVAGPVTEFTKDLSYYGANSVTVRDALLPEAVAEACTKVNPTVDFSKYDHILIYAAGPSEADGAGDEKIWPQASTLGQLSIVLDGRKIDAYGVCCEIAPDGISQAGIGDMCHELGHLLGLKDLYDVSSGGGPEYSSGGLGGTLSLMDCGNRLDEGRTPSLLAAVDLDLLGKGESKPLTVGHHVLPARGEESSVFLKLEKQGESFLFECRRQEGQDAFIDREGLIWYHVDRSSNPAGWSSSQMKELTAAQRWQYNEVNTNPDHECATLCDRLVWWDGTTSTLAIRNVRDGEDGAVEFDVLEALAIEELTVFQDAVILKWRSDLETVASCSVALKKEGGEWEELPSERECLLIEGLDDGSDYTLRIQLMDSEGEEFSVLESFATPKIRLGTWPFIYLYGVERNDDGSFKAGGKLPLRLYNPNGVSSVQWYFNGNEITVGDDCYWHIPGSGVLRAVVNGGSEILEKKINVK